jgi:tetratricopeptide (TPR) repeat protein
VKTYSRIATELGELAAAEHNSAAFQEALELHLRAVALAESALNENPANAATRRRLGDELIALSYLRALSSQNLDQGLEECRRAREIIQNQAASDRANAEAQQDLSSTYFVTARILQAKGDFAGAAQSYRSCLEILEPLVALHPENVETAFDLTRVRDGLSAVTSRDISR